jgi:hypothetical protein
MISVWVVRTSTSCNRSAPKVSFRKQYSCSIVRNFFDFIAPSSGKFDCALASFDSSVHKEGLLIAKNVVKFFFNQPELAVVNRS